MAQLFKWFVAAVHGLYIAKEAAGLIMNSKNDKLN